MRLYGKIHFYTKVTLTTHNVGIGTWVKSGGREKPKFTTKRNLSSTTKNIELKAIYFSTDTFCKLSKKEV